MNRWKSARFPFMRLQPALTALLALTTWLACAQTAARLVGAIASIEGSTITVKTDAGHWVYPIWQFARKHKRVMLGIRDCLAELPFEHEWEPIFFFLSKMKCLDGHSPLDRLRAGKIEAAILAARRYGRRTDA